MNVTHAPISLLACLPLAMTPALAAEKPGCEAPAPIAQKQVQLPSAVVGRPYARQLIQAGAPPYTLAFTAGTPEEIGLALGPDGRQAGVPARAGGYAFTVSVLDADGCVLTRQAYLIRVLPAGRPAQ